MRLFLLYPLLYAHLLVNAKLFTSSPSKDRTCRSVPESRFYPLRLIENHGSVFFPLEPSVTTLSTDQGLRQDVSFVADVVFGRSIHRLRYFHRNIMLTVLKVCNLNLPDFWLALPRRSLVQRFPAELTVLASQYHQELHYQYLSSVTASKSFSPVFICFTI